MSTSFEANAGPLASIQRADCLHGPIEQLTRPVLTTAEAAHYLNRKQQTLRIWACRESGPIRPIRVHGRLGWRLSDVRRCLGMEQAAAARLAI